MASTNKTSNLNLSQFIGSDTPTWLVDYNGDMEKIDAGVDRVEKLAETASTQAVGVASGLQATNQNVTTLSGQVANVQNQANTTTASVNGINQRLGNTDISGVGDGTVTGAINALNSNLNMKWNLKGTTTGTTPINLPESWNELLIHVKIGGNDVRCMTQYILKSMITSVQRFCLGALETHGCAIYVNNDNKTAYLESAKWGSAGDVTQSTTVTIYYR